MDHNNQQKMQPVASSNPGGNKKLLAALISVVAVVGLLLVCTLVIGGWWLLGQRSTQLPNEARQDGNLVVTTDEADLSEMVKRVSPSVVSILTTQTTGGSFLQSEAEGAGTGIIISADGYVLTNKHVVADARSVQVVTSDGAQYAKVRMIGSDPLNDLAFLKIEGASNLPAATLGDSGTVRVGQKVIAIGNSLGQYQNTVTSGIISGKGRPIEAATDEYGAEYEVLTDLLQTDAAINPGNSGGPLINMSGQVIGINTAIVSEAQSMGFAIPINAARGLIRGVLSSGKIQKAYIGVQYLEITPDVRAEYRLDDSRGALVKSAASGQSAVAADGPAAQAGVRDGDIITKINDKVIGEHGGLGSLISEFLPGEKLTLTIKRDGREQTLNLTLGAYQD